MDRRSQQGAEVSAAFVCVALILAAAARPAGTATTFFVDQNNPSCSNTGSGSDTQPFCRIGPAAAQAVAGDTVVVASGTYNEDVKPANSGTSTAPIVFQTASGASVTVGSGQAHGFTLSSSSWIIVQGFDVTGTTGDGVFVASSSNITLVGNHVSSCGQQIAGQTARGITLSAVTDSLVAANVVDHNSDHGIFLTMGTTRVTVLSNILSFNASGFQRAATGITVSGSTTTANVIDSNVSHDNEDSGINFTTAGGNVVRNNISHHNGDYGIDNFNSPGQVIVGNSVYSNVTSGGINLKGTTGSTGSSGATIENNIVVDNGTDPAARTRGNIRVDTSSTSGTTVDYNLVFLSQPGTMYFWDAASYASLSAFQAATGQEAHGLQGDPLWVSPSTGDLHLQEFSPAIDSANSAAPDWTAADAEGNPRVDDPNVPNTGAGPFTSDDRGALEFTGSSTTTSSSTSSSTTTSSSTPTTSPPTTSTSTSTSSSSSSTTSSTAPHSTSSSTSSSTTTSSSTPTTVRPTTSTSTSTSSSSSSTTSSTARPTTSSSTSSSTTTSTRRSTSTSTSLPLCTLAGAPACNGTCPIGTCTPVAGAICACLPSISTTPANAPPDCSAARPDPAELWPPNQALVAVSIVGLTDPDNDPLRVTITRITQDEPEVGTCQAAAAGVNTDTAILSAERAGAGDGRVYHVSFTADDGRGGQCGGTVNVCVPHDQGRGHVCVDQGALVDSTAPCG